jgi:large subunit ribosomal protein L29
MVDVKELRQLSEGEMKEKERELGRDLFQMRCEMRLMRKLEKPHSMKAKRRQRARLLTLLREKELKS